MAKRKEKVAVAMSGGVDSSVAAALLQERGFEVMGIFMRMWSDCPLNCGNGNRGCPSEAENRAREVAGKLGIPFYVLGLEEEFKKRVVEKFLAAEKEGRTPNPCVDCNKEVKFGLFLEEALKMGAEKIATGHYARLKEGPEGRELWQAKDHEKDQSYFLWQLNQEQLGKVIFPIGDYKRSEVEELAKKLKLPFEGVEKSMEVCFIPETTESFLKKYLQDKPGEIKNMAGKTIGAHRGLWFQTLGQRKGLGLGAGTIKTAAEKPYFVVGKNLKRNILVVSQNKGDLLKRELTVEKVNWISGRGLQKPLGATVKIRYHSRGVKARIEKIGKDKYRVLLEKPQGAITPGQSAVFFKGEILLGGGIIKR